MHTFKNRNRNLVNKRAQDLSKLTYNNIRTGKYADLLQGKIAKQWFENEKIFLQGNKFRGVYFIAKGSVNIQYRFGKKGNFVLWNVGVNDFIGLDSVITGDSYSADALVVQDACLYFIERKEFIDFISGRPFLIHDLIKVMCRRLNSIEEQLEVLRPNGGVGRPAKNSLCEDLDGISGKSRGMKLKLDDLARLAGTTRECLYKVLSQFSSENLISVDKERLIIRNVDGLVSWSGSTQITNP